MVRRGIKPGNSKTLWDAVNLAKNCNIETIPESLTLNNIKLNPNDRAQAFANFFKEKVQTIVDSSQISNNVYNGIYVEC